MNKKNFFLLDIMKTGYHENYRDFINLNSLIGEEFHITQEYYDVSKKIIQKYDRKLAILDTCLSTEKFLTNEVYVTDLKKRIKNLKDIGFKFIIAHPWESKDNMKGKKFYKDYFKAESAFSWSGKHNYFWFLMNEKHKNHNYNFNHNHKKFDFLYLNKQSRSHRKKLFDVLQEKSLLDNSLISFLDAPYNIKLNPSYELPWVDANNYPRYGSDQDIFEPQFNDTAFNIVSETNDNNHDIFMTEKIWKPIIAQQIFIVHGNLHYLEKMRKMGFLTFNSVFDESYDLEENPDKRIEKIVSLCCYLKHLDKQKIYEKTQQIRQHNYNHFFNKTALSISVNETVSSFLKFFDRV